MEGETLLLGEPWIERSHMDWKLLIERALMGYSRCIYKYLCDELFNRSGTTGGKKWEAE
jgi:hypothetical protein